MKKIIWVVLVVILVVAAYMLLVPKPVGETGDRTTASGTVLSVNVDGVAFDGPALVTIEAEDGEERVVAVPSMGINLCAAVEDIADVYTLEEGDRVSVRGELDEEGRIVPCTDASHYLRVE